MIHIFNQFYICNQINWFCFKYVLTVSVTVLLCDEMFMHVFHLQYFIFCVIVFRQRFVKGECQLIRQQMDLLHQRIGNPTLYKKLDLTLNLVHIIVINSKKLTSSA